MDIEKVIRQNQLKIDKEKIKYNEPMNLHTSFKVGGPAECYIKIENYEELVEILRFAKRNNINITIIGNGSNILVKDSGIKGIVLQINIKKYELKKEDKKITLSVGAGNKLSEIAQKLVNEEITGFEELSGIPGTIGGAIKMNAGAHGKEIKDILQNATVCDLDGDTKKLENKDLKFSYRSSVLNQQKYIVLEAEFNLDKGTKEEIKQKMEEYKKYRTEKQPLEYPSAGSTFKRGENYITAKLIDEAGLKGYSIGGAQVSEKHAGFIINKGNATATDILQLIEHVEKTIYDKFKEKIKLEIEILGD